MTETSTVFPGNVTNSYNMSSNSTNNDGVFDHQFNKWIAFGLFVGIMFFNVLVMVLLIKSKTKSRMAFTVKNLAISDICVGIFYLLPQLVFNYLVLLDWTSGLCAAFGFFHMFAFHVSTNAIVAMTLDRLFVIIRPLSTFSKTCKYRCLLAGSSWVLGAVFSIPHAIFHKMDGIDCFNNNTYRKIELWVTGSLLIFIPVAIIVVCYGIMIWQLHNRSIGFIYTKEGNLHQGMISKTKIRTVKLLLIVVIVYIICWAPIFIGSLLIIYGIPIHDLLKSGAYVLAPLNSLTNPLVFLIFNRKMFKKKENNGKRNGIKGDRSTRSISKTLLTSVRLFFKQQ